MAEETQAATATAMAPDTGTASSVPAMSAARDKKGMELTGDTTIDVESLLAGPFEDTPANDEQDPDAESEEDSSEINPAAEDSELQEEPDSEEDPDESPENAEDAELLKALKPKAIKRFNKLLAQRDEALAKIRDIERQRDELQTKLAEEGSTPVPVKIDSDPLAVAINEEHLEAHERHYQDVIRWCRRNPAGGTPPKHLTGGQEMELDQEAVLENLETAEDVLKAIPKRRAFLTQFREQTAEARKLLPEMFTKGTPEHQAAQEAQRKLINFHQQPDQAILLAKLVKIERMEREEKAGIARYPRVPMEKAKATAQATASARPAAPSKATVPPVRPTNGTASNPAQRLAETKGAIDIEDLIGA
jgi:hypothetical protein